MQNSLSFIANYESSSDSEADSDSDTSNSESKTQNISLKKRRKDENLVNVQANKRIKTVHAINSTLNTATSNTTRTLSSAASINMADDTTEKKKKARNNNTYKLFIPRQLKSGVSNIVTEENFKRK